MSNREKVSVETPSHAAASSRDKYRRGGMSPLSLRAWSWLASVVMALKRFRSPLRHGTQGGARTRFGRTRAENHGALRYVGGQHDVYVGTAHDSGGLRDVMFQTRESFALDP